MRDIVIFGGSFNPPHLGHEAVISFLASLSQFDEVWVMPTFAHPFGKSLSSFEQRVALCERMVAGLSDKVKVCAFEGELKRNPSYTSEVIKELKKRYPDIRITLAVGSDCRADLPKWHDWKGLKNEVRFLFFPRAGYEKNSPFPRMSSTEIRKRMRN